MTFIYDILVNFSDTLYDFYEWNKKDNIIHIKKIPVFKVDNKTINDIIENKVKINNNFLEMINDVTEKYDFKKVKYACILSNGEKVIALEFDNKGYEINRSKLMFDDEDEINNYIDKIKITNIDYTKLSKINNNFLLTRKETTIKNILIKEINKSYSEKEYQKLKYLYYEYTNKICNNIDKIYKDLISSLNNNFTEKHLLLYEVLLLEMNKK